MNTVEREREGQGREGKQWKEKGKRKIGQSRKRGEQRERDENGREGRVKKTEEKEWKKLGEIEKLRS